MQINRGISSREDLLAALAAQFECADRIEALSQHITELASLESVLSRSAADYAASHPEAMTSPLAPVRPDISQGVVRAGNATYTLTETRGERLTRLWSRSQPPRRLRSDRLQPPSGEALHPSAHVKTIDVQLLGAQDATTYEQNAVTRGHTGLCQGVGLNCRYQVSEDEGLFVIAADGAEKKLTITDCSAGTIDFTVPDDVEAGEYRVEVRSHAGEGKNRTLVKASINGFTVKEG